MVQAYSIDLRERVVLAVSSGGSCRAVAARFGVAVSTVVKWHQLYRRTGGVAPGKMGGHRALVLAPHRDWLLARIKQQSDVTLHGLKGELKARGISVSHDTIWRYLRREKMSFKKKPVCG